MIFNDSAREASGVERDEAFRQSLAALSLQLAERKLPEPPEIPIAADEDEPPVVHKRPVWHRIALVVLLLVAVFAGYRAFRGNASVPATPPSAPAPQAENVMPPPPNGPAPPTDSDFGSQAKALESDVAVAPPPPPVEQSSLADITPLDRKDIQEVQTRLQALGISPGPIDGFAGRLTQAAVRRYEESKGQPSTGNVDGNLLKRLREDDNPR